MWCEEDNCFLYEDEHDAIHDNLLTNEEVAKEYTKKLEDLKEDAKSNDLMWCDEDECFLYENAHEAIHDDLLTNNELAKEYNEKMK